MSEESHQTDSGSADSSRVWRRRIFFFLRLAVSIGLMAAIVLYYVPPEDRPRIITSYADANLFWLGMAVLATFTDRLVSGLKWLLLLRVREPELPAWPVMQIFFVSTFFGYFLPSSIGGDALRVYSLSRMKGDLAGSTSSVIIDRAYGTLGLLLLSAIAVIPAAGVAITWPETALLWTFTGGALLFVLLLSSRRTHGLIVSLFRLDRGGAVRGRIHKFVNAFATYLHRKWVLVGMFTMSLMVQVLRVLIVFFFGLSLGLELNPVVYFIYVPVITVITFLPFSIAGIGVREGLFVFFFARPEVGLSQAVAVSLSLLFFSSGVIATIPGLLVYLFTGAGKKAVTAEN